MTKILEEIGAESGAGRERRRKSFPHSYKASIALDAYDIRVYDRLHLEYCANIGATRRELFRIYSLDMAG